MNKSQNNTEDNEELENETVKLNIHIGDNIYADEGKRGDSLWVPTMYKAHSAGYLKFIISLHSLKKTWDEALAVIVAVIIGNTLVGIVFLNIFCDE